MNTYGSLENIQIITLAPELNRSAEVIKELTKRSIVVSVGTFSYISFDKALTSCLIIGHSMANLAIGEEAVKNGATFITHLFNAMLPVSDNTHFLMFQINVCFILVSSQGPRLNWSFDF